MSAVQMLKLGLNNCPVIEVHLPSHIIKAKSNKGKFTLINTININSKIKLCLALLVLQDLRVMCVVCQVAKRLYTRWFSGRINCGAEVQHCTGEYLLGCSHVKLEQGGFRQDGVGRDGRFNQLQHNCLEFRQSGLLLLMKSSIGRVEIRPTQQAVGAYFVRRCCMTEKPKRPRVTGSD